MCFFCALQNRLLVLGLKAEDLSEKVAVGPSLCAAPTGTGPPLPGSSRIQLGTDERALRGQGSRSESKAFSRPLERFTVILNSGEAAEF